ncbi:MAG: 5-formyltetrahydrofolate cyclo-ligase [Proteobacteria bacterium]|nr:5-formyltetrahydrofolate cyclo-ligase [Pseudomonadota bacterium]
MDTNKTTIRAAARARRASLPRAGYADAIAKFATDLSLAPGAVVGGYFPIRDEADPRALMSALAALGHPLALPAITPGQPLVFRAWKMGDAMHANAQAFNIPEPLASAPEVTPTVVLVPLLAFDATGHRLGYGGGYYDRTLTLLARAQTPPANPSARAPAFAIGVAYAGQEIAAVPREPHDLPLNAVITEAGVRRFQKT